MTAEEVLQRVAAKGQPVDREWALQALEKGLAQYMPVGKQSGLMGYLMQDGTAVLYAGAGDLGELLACLPALTAWYRRAGATRLWMTGRKGWLRVLERRGWRRDGDGLVKDLVP